MTGAQTIAQANSSTCSLQGSVPGLSYVALAQATVVANTVAAASGYTYGHIGADVQTNALVNLTTTAGPGSPYGQVTVDANADITQDFSSAGPLRMGNVTFTGAGGCFVNNAYRGCSGVTFFDGVNAPVNISNDFCYVQVGIQCDSETFAIELGSTFAVEAAASISATYSPDEGSQIGNNPGVTFKLQELDGTPVDVALVPEPSALWLVGMVFACCCLSRNARLLPADGIKLRNHLRWKLQRRRF